MLEWTHNESRDCFMGDNCPGKETCEYFPTTGDRIAMARAAYEAYAEADGTDLGDFVQSVAMLARSEGLVETVWLVIEHSPRMDTRAFTVRKIYATRGQAQRYARAKMAAGFTDGPLDIIEMPVEGDLE